MAYKPAGYTDVSPYLITEDPAGVIAFLIAGLGAAEIRRFNRPDGSIMHAEVHVGDSVVMIGGGKTEHKAQPAHVHVYVADVDEAFARAVKAGGVVVQKPAKKDDPDRRCGVSDPSGTVWWLATNHV